MEIEKGERIAYVHMSTCVCFLETAMLVWILPHPYIILPMADAICVVFLFFRSGRKWFA